MEDDIRWMHKMDNVSTIFNLRLTNDNLKSFQDANSALSIGIDASGLSHSIV